MSKKTFNITLGIGIALGLITLILAFLCEFTMAFYCMIVFVAYSICLKDEWEATYYRGFEPDEESKENQK